MMKKYVHCWILSTEKNQFKFSLLALFLGLFLSTGQGVLFAFPDEKSRLFFDRALRAYLFETALRNWPLIPSGQYQQNVFSVPAWPYFDQMIDEADDIGPNPDLALLQSWKFSWEQQNEQALRYAEHAWLADRLAVFSQLQVGLTYLRCLKAMNQDQQLVQAWLSWEQKYLDPEVLTEGLDAMERLKDPQRVSLLQQAIQLYPTERRFLELLLLNQARFPSLSRFISQDIRKGNHWSEASLRSLLRRLERTRENHKIVVKLLWEAGLRSRDLQIAAFLEGLTTLDPLLPQNLSYDDYLLWSNVWLKTGSGMEQISGIFEWDTDNDGTADAWVTLDSGKIERWYERSNNHPEGSFLAIFKDSQLIKTIEKRKDESWSLIWEEYPYLNSIEWTKENEREVFHFEPYQVAQSLFQKAKMDLPQPLWPLSLRLPDARPGGILLEEILPLAVRKSLYKNGSLIKRLYLTQSQVWMVVEDSNEDQHPDTWSFFKEGKLDSVYRRFSPSSATLLELYQQGQLNRLLVNSDRDRKTEFAFFPHSQVELWDWNQKGTPIMRVVQTDNGQIKVLVFNQTTPPFLTMPAWPIFPWP